MLKVRDWVQMVVAGLVVAAFFAHAAMPYRVVGPSMEPSLREGSWVIVSRLVDWGVGDVVVARTEFGETVKRITREENGEWWLEGDNRGQSTDSREWGTVKKNAVVGRVVAKIW